MTDTDKAAAVADNVANGETEVHNPTTAEKNGEAPAETTAKSKNTTYEDRKDAAEETNGNAEANGEHADQHTHSPDNKRKGDDDHYHEGTKRSRGGGRGGRGGRGRGGGRGGHFQNKRNIMTSFEDLKETDDPVEIRRQVEFYFSDSNLPVDGYLLGMVEGSKNLPVDLRTIHNFKRMRHFQPFTAVVKAVQGSKVLNVEEKDNTAYVTRKSPLSDKFSMETAENKKLLTSDTMERSIYAKGFGDEAKRTHLDIEEFFEPYGPINSVRLRRTDDGEFKGSVFVEFGDVNTQQAFLALDPKPTWGKDDKELEIMSKQAYVEKKNDAILSGHVRPRSPRHTGFGGRGGNSKRGGRGGGFKDRRYSDKRDRSRSPGNDDWKARRDRDQRNGNRDDRKRSQRGGSRGGRGRGGRDDRKRRDRDEDDEHDRSQSPGDDRNGRLGEDDFPTRAEAEAKKAQEHQITNRTDDVEAGAEKSEGGSKKRAREDDDADAEGGEAKKVKETEVEP